MNQFEIAKQKAEAKKEKQLRGTLSLPTKPAAPIEPIEPVVPKEKLKKDAYIEVKVCLPNGDISFTLFKQSVLANASESRLTKDEFKKCLIQGLKPLLGDVIELPRGG